MKTTIEEYIDKILDNPIFHDNKDKLFTSYKMSDGIVFLDITFKESLKNIEIYKKVDTYLNSFDFFCFNINGNFTPLINNVYYRSIESISIEIRNKGLKDLIIEINR